jgi:hypothetical protein
MPPEGGSVSPFSHASWLSLARACSLPASRLFRPVAGSM